ncbi:MAG: 4Fe-4S binding protein [Methanosarcinales archaeon]|nr:4Fe-4S binding protein [Methanosarcinales archaeon]
MQQLPVLPSWKAFFDKDLCAGCEKCARVCWTGAISMLIKEQ